MENKLAPGDSFVIKGIPHVIFTVESISLNYYLVKNNQNDELNQLQCIELDSNIPDIIHVIGESFSYKAPVPEPEPEPEAKNYFSFDDL